MNRSALRYAARQFTSYFLLLVAALYVWAGVYTGDPLDYLVWAALFVALSVGTFCWRYRDGVDAHEATIERAQYAEVIAAQRAEHATSMARITEELRAQQEERDAEVLAGDRCAIECDGCADERRESDRLNAEYRRERAQRHAGASVRT